MESIKGKPVITENPVKSFTERYFERLNESIMNDPDYINEADDFEGKNITINEKVNNIFEKINTIIKENEYNGQKTLEDSGLSESKFDEDFYEELNKDDE